MAFVARVNDQIVRVSLGKAGERLKRRAVHRIAGEVMRTSIKDTFEKEGFPAKSWRRVRSSTLAAQFTRGNERRKRPRKTTKLRGGETVGFQRFRAGKKVLTDKGRLQNTITYKSRGRSLFIGTNLVYARIHQRGGVITAKGARALRIPLGDGRVIFRKRVVIPARPFLLIKPKDPETIGEAIADSATEPLKP